MRAFSKYQLGCCIEYCSSRKVYLGSSSSEEVFFHYFSFNFNFEATHFANGETEAQML